MRTTRLALASAAVTLLALGAAAAQTMPPTAEELQQHNDQNSQDAAASVRAQNQQTQLNLQNDQARQSQLFANQPNAAAPYLPPPLPPAPPR